MKVFYYLIAWYFLPYSFISAQASIDLCLAKSTDHWMLIVRPDADFQGVFSNLQLTLELEGLQTHIQHIHQSPEVASLIPLQFAGQYWQFQGNTYQKIIGLGTETLDENQSEWIADSSYAILKIFPSDMQSNLNLSITKDTELKNGEYYVELNSYDKTGIEFNSCLPNIAMVSKDKEISQLAPSIYPNPSKGLFYVESLEIGELEVEIINAIGEKVYTKKRILNRPGDTSIDISLYPEGMYFVRVKNNSGIFSFPILKI